MSKQDSNLTGLSYAEETSLKVLPGTPVWKEVEPNSYSDFGGENTLTPRTPIKADRQRKKGVLTDLDAMGGWNQDFTQQSLVDLLQGFYWADAREKAKTQPLNGTQIPITNVDATGKTYDAASGLTIFKANDLIYASGYTNTENDGLKVATAATATDVTVAETLVDEAAPPAAAKLEAVGFQFPSGDLDVSVGTTTVTLETTATDCTTLGLVAGEYIGIGGDSASLQFVSNGPGYGRVKSVSTNAIVLDDTTFTPANETGTGLTVQIFFGTVIKNEETASLIVRRSYQLERTLGEDANGTQSEYITGAIPNEFTLNVPSADKMNADLTFVGMDTEYRDGTTGVKSGTRQSAVCEDAYNTSSDIYRTKLSVLDPTGINPDGLFAYVTEATIAINNGVTPDKAVGVLGAFNASTGDFAVTASLSAYFEDIDGPVAVKANSDVSFNMIATQNNTGFVFDIPLGSLGGGKLEVEKDTAINMPLELEGAASCDGYTMLSSFYNYLPDSLMS